MQILPRKFQEAIIKGQDISKAIFLGLKTLKKQRKLSLELSVVVSRMDQIYIYFGSLKTYFVTQIFKKM